MIVIGILSLFLGIGALALLKKWYNPVTVFSFMWAIIFFLYTLKLVPYYDISDQTQWVLLLQMFGFAAGGIWGFYDPVRLNIKGKTLKDRTSIRIPLIYALCAVSIMVLLGDTVEIIKSLASGMTFDDIAEEGLITENDTTGVMVVIKIFIMFPTAHCLPAIAAAELFFGKNKHRWILTGLSAVISVLYALQHGARYTLILFVACNAIALVFSGKQNMLNKKVRRLMIAGCLLATFFMFWLSSSRGIENIWLSIYKYFAGIPALMDQWIQRTRESDVMTYGATVTWGITYPFIVLLRGVGIIRSVPDILQTAFKFINDPETPIAIGYGAGLNAHVGPSYAFFCDGRYLFVLLGMFLYGYISTRAYKRALERADTGAKADYLFWISLVIYSFVRFPFTSYMFGMALLMVYFVYGREKRVQE